MTPERRLHGERDAPGLRWWPLLQVLCLGLLAAGLPGGVPGLVAEDAPVCLQPELRFTPVALIGDELARSPGGDLAAADLNRDGLPDLALLNPWTASLSVVATRTVPGSIQMEVERHYPLPWRASLVTAADFNGNGHIDLAVLAERVPEFALLYNGGPGWLTKPWLHTVEIEGRPLQFQATDLDGDGACDIVLFAEDPDGAFHLRNSGNGSFELIPLPREMAEIDHIVIADLDGDGLSDVAGAESRQWVGGGWSDSELTVFTNTEGGGFTRRSRSYAEGNAVDLAVLDVDGDSRLDFAIFQSVSYTEPAEPGLQIRIFRNSPSEAPVPLANFEVPWPLREIQGGDLDGDGFGDLTMLVHRPLPPPHTRAYFQLGRGDGTFESPLAVELHGYPLRHVLLDLDGDERLDLAARLGNPERSLAARLSRPQGSLEDCDSNGIPDGCDIVEGRAGDCNLNGVPDACEFPGGLEDCGGPEGPDLCDPQSDCNGNGVFDGCDIERGTSQDLDRSGVPDECEQAPALGQASFEITSSARLQPDGSVRRDAVLLLELEGRPPDVPGIQGWSVFVTATGCSVAEATTSGTVAGLASEGPPGVRDAISFEATHILDCICPRGFHGTISAVVLGLVDPIALEAGGGPHPVLGLSLESPSGADGECLDCVLGLVDVDDCNRCHRGEPIRNAVTVDGNAYPVDSTPLVVSFCAEPFRRGDVDQDGRLDLSDGMAVFGFLFLGDDAPRCLDASDSNDDGHLDVADGIFVLSYLFLGTPPPPAPGPPPGECGRDPTPEAAPLDCERYLGC